MTTYLEKYKKYKTKYLNLLKKTQKGGAIEITFDLNKYKPLYRKFIFELNHEMAFSLDYDPNDRFLISEFLFDSHKRIFIAGTAHIKHRRIVEISL